MVGIAFGALLPRVERMYFDDQFPAGFGVGSATTLLGSVATGLITVIGLSVSVLIAGLTFGSSSLTPRIIGEWQESAALKLITGVLLLSVVYAFVVLQQIAPRESPEFVPDLAVWLVLPLLAIDVLALLGLARATAQFMRFVEVLDAIHSRACSVIDGLYVERVDPELKAPQEPDARPRHVLTVSNTDRSGVIASIDARFLGGEAKRLGITIQLAPAIGEYVGYGAPLFRVWPASAEIDRDRLVQAVAVSDERTITQDPLFAVRLLADIGIRALSPAINDPTTAVQALDRIDDLLRRVADRRLDVGEVQDSDGRILLRVRTPAWEDFLEVGLTEFRQYGHASTQVLRRLRALLLGLLDLVDETRGSAVERQLELLDAATVHSFLDPRERAEASIADTNGLGSGLPVGSR